MSAISITLRVATLLAGDERMPVYSYVIDHPGERISSQNVVVDSGQQPIVLAGDTAVWFGELDDPVTEGQRLIRALNPRQVWLAHSATPWQPGPGSLLVTTDGIVRSSCGVAGRLTFQ